MMSPEELKQLEDWAKLAGKYKFAGKQKKRLLGKVAGMISFLEPLEHSVNYLKNSNSKTKDDDIKELKLHLEIFLMDVYPQEYKERHEEFVSDFNESKDKIECIRRWVFALKREVLFLLSPEQIKKAKEFKEIETDYGIKGKFPLIGNAYFKKKIKEKKG